MRQRQAAIRLGGLDKDNVFKIGYILTEPSPQKSHIRRRKKRAELLERPIVVNKVKAREI
jgi:hypothetical protein